MQEIIVDYVHDDKLKVLALMATRSSCSRSASPAAFAILKLSFGV